MRLLAWLSLGAFGLSTLIAIALHLPATIPHAERLFWLPFLAAFACLFPTLRRLSKDRPPEQAWAHSMSLLRRLPRTIQIGLLLLFALVSAQFIALVLHQENQLEFKRTYAATAVWICAASAALAFGRLRQPAAGDATEH